MDANKLHILFIEDEEAHAELIRRAFDGYEEQYKLSMARNLSEARGIIEADQPDLVVTDYLLPDGQGIQLLAQSGQSPAYPVVVMTSQGNEQIAVDSLKAGALDYVVKTPDTLMDMPHVVERTLREWFHILKRREAEVELQKSLNLLQAVFDATNDTIFVKDLDGRYVFTNKVGARAINKEVEEIIGKTDKDLFSEATYEKFYTVDREVIESGDSHIVEEVVRSHNNLERIFLSSKSPFYDEKNQIVGVVGISRDITERVQMEQTLIAREKLAGIGSLAAGIVHEMNSPLQVITGLSQRLQQMIDKDQYEKENFKRSLDSIQRNAWRMAEIVRSLLNYARSPTGSMKESDINDLVKDTLLLMEHQLTSWMNITVEPCLQEGLPNIFCDSNRITQVLVNLITNARDAMPDGGFIAIKTAYETSAKMVTIRVTDTGRGVPEELHEKIFEPFFTTKEIGDGTGVGLSIVKEIVEAHGGKVELEDSSSSGTTFKVQLPVEARRKTGPLQFI